MTKRILAIVPDLLIETRIEGAAKGLDAIVEAVSAQEAMKRIASSEPELVIVDVGAPGLDLESIAQATREMHVPLVGFYPHIDVALRRSAAEAGVQHLYPRSRFLRELPAILRDRLQD